MFIYILTLLTMYGLLCVAGYFLYRNIRKKSSTPAIETRILEDPDEVLTVIMADLHAHDTEHEREARKHELMDTLLELHQSGLFCTHLSEAEMVRYIKKHLNMRK